MLLADLSEDDRILKALAPAIPEGVRKANLNSLGFSDYYFSAVSGTFQFSRKQAGEILSDLDVAEQQLAKYYPMADHNVQVVEGIITPMQLGTFPVKVIGNAELPSIRGMGSGMFAYKVEVNGFIHGGQQYPHIQEAMWYAWLNRLAQAGIPTYFTMSWFHTANLIAAIYRNEQKPIDEHATLNRIIVPRVYIKEHSDLKRALVFLSHALKLDIGEDRAESIANKYSSIKEVLGASVKELCECPGIGKVTADKLLRKLGEECPRKK